MDITRYKKIYDDLLKYNIELNYEDIPLPSYIQQKIIQCNNYQHIVEKYFIEVTRDLALAERMYSVEKLNIETLKRSILTTNEEIKKIATGKEREAAVDGLLENKYKELLKLENDVNELKSLLSAIKQKQITLKNVNSDIKALIKLMDNMINRLNVGSPNDPEIKKLNEIYKDIEKLEEDNDDFEEETNEYINSEDTDVIVENKDSNNISFESTPEEKITLKDDPIILKLEEDYSSNVIFDPSLSTKNTNIEDDIEIDISSINLTNNSSTEVTEIDIDSSKFINTESENKKIREEEEKEKEEKEEKNNEDDLLDSLMSILDQ